MTGSVAGTLYGEPRVTHDVDIVMRLPGARVHDFVQQFPLDGILAVSGELVRADVVQTWVDRLGLAEAWQRLSEAE